ncbi:ABC transporter substrate-binding protein [Neobacillus sp. Marseille-QA0830]
MKNKKNMMLTLVISLIAVLMLASCSSNSTKTSGEKTAKSGETSSSNEEKVLTIANPTDIESFDIHNNNNTMSEAVLVNMFDYLIQNDSEGNKIPVLATEWKKVNDTTWQFKLRNDVTFHNGDPFTAADVKFTLERAAKDSSLKQNYLYKQIKEVQIVDDYTVNIVTEVPDPLLLNRLSRMGSGMLPSKYIQENGMEAFLQKPVGTGPYKFSSWKKDDRLELVKNENYFGGKVKWDKVVFRTIPEASTRVSELLAGGVDIASSIPSTDVARIKDAEGKSIEKAPTRRVLQMIVRHTEGTVTSDPVVREAIDLAIDKKGIIESIAGGAGVLTRTSVTPGNFGSDPSLYKKSLYDPEKAKKLLKDAGYSKEDLKISLSVATQYGEYAEVVASMLNEVGFDVNLNILESTAFYEQFNAKKFGELFMIGIGNSLNDASNNYGRYLADQAAGETDYNNPEVEELLQSALVNMDPKSRESQYQKVQQIFAKERPAIYLFQMEGVYGVNDKVKYAPREDEMYYVQEVTPTSK